MNQDTRNVLAALDQQKTSWFHFKTIVIAGMGFFTDAYDLFCIGLLTKTIGRIYYQFTPDLNPGWNQTQASDPVSNPKYLPCSLSYSAVKNTAGVTVIKACPKPGVLPINSNAAVTGTALCGTLAGQLVWGWLGDVYGRKTVYGYTLITMVVCALGQAMSYGNTSKAVIGTLCMWRFFLGFGIGGDYPLSATIMSEYSSTKTRGAFVGSVFATQGLGYLTAATYTIIVVGIAQLAWPSYGYLGTDPLASVPAITDMVWRTVLCFGAVPAGATLYWRSMMPETARYTALVKGDAATTASNMGHVLGRKFDAAHDVPIITAVTKKEHNFNEYMRERPRGMRWNNGIMLFGCASTWFLLDIAFYSQNLFQKDVFTTIGWLPAAQNISALEECFYVGRAQALIALGSTIPGYWFTVFTIDYIGRWPIQIGGFFMMTLWMAILAGDYNDLVQNNVNGFVVMYALTFFFANWGPNSTTFIIPAELFAARFRSTCHGISAAAGKAGAIVGAFGFLWASQAEVGATDYAKCGLSATAAKPCNSTNFPKTPDAGYPNGAGLRVSLGILAATNFLGMLCTAFVPETLGRSLEDLSGEDGEETIDGKLVGGKGFIQSHPVSIA